MMTSAGELHEQPDGQLIAQSMADGDAFGSIYDRHAPAIAAYLSRRVAADAVEGLLSDVFVAAFEARARFDTGRSSALPWLYGIAGNLVRRHHRSAERERRANRRAATLRLVDDTSARPFDEVVQVNADNQALLSQLATIIGKQSDVDREVLLLFAWEELSYAEIADAVGIPVGTVKSKLNRIRRSLRRSQNG
jgi:RNA polymerase sigma-70 factor (ECF subfamily)